MSREDRPQKQARPLRVAIDARLRHGESGGVESVVVGLAEGLSSLEGDERYIFLTLRDEDRWITGHLHGNARALRIPGRARMALRRARGRLEGAVPGFNSFYRALRTSSEAAGAGPPLSDGTIERAGIDVMHFVSQAGFLTKVPTIYHPHDLQHRHFPELFDPAEREFRDEWYGALSKQAAMVAVASSWTRDDVVRELHLPSDKVWVVPWAPPIDAFAAAPAVPEEVRSAMGLPGAFVLYPAQTWPHKNHIRLLEALSLIRQQHGLVIPLVLTGRRNAGAALIDEAVERLGMAEQVRWLGFLEGGTLKSVYRAATAVIIPSRFEAASGPLWEAFALGIPAACSNVTSLPEQAGDAALLFDPDSVEEIAEVVVRLWTDKPFRMTLVERGYRQVAGFTWDKTARLFRSHYRRLASRPLTDDDELMLSARSPL